MAQGAESIGRRSCKTLSLRVPEELGIDVGTRWAVGSVFMGRPRELREAGKVGGQP